jgi:hypothetical protein
MRLEVEVVAGLVQQHAVGAHQQDAGQGDAHLPAAGKQADVAVHPLLAEAEAGQDLAGASLQRIAVELLEALLHLAVAFDDGVELVGLAGVDHGGLEAGHLGGEGADGTDAVHHRGDGALALHLADVLAEVADGHAGIDDHEAVVRLLLSGDHAEEGGLAGAVRADEADLLALLDAHGGVDEQELVAVLLGDVVEADHRAVC